MINEDQIGMLKINKKGKSFKVLTPLDSQIL